MLKNIKKNKNIALITHEGKVRDHNEDSILNYADRLFVVADGVGGNNSGEVASATLIAKMKEIFKRSKKKEKKNINQIKDFLEKSVLEGNKTILKMAEENEEYARMATTVAAIYKLKKQIVIAHVGDSRIYRYDRYGLVQLSKDHSLVQEMLDRGEITGEVAFDHPRKNVITRAVGLTEELQVDMDIVDFRKGDIYLICSDGLSDIVRDIEIDAIIGRNSDDMNMAMEQLLNKALENGGKDNISIILIKI